MIKLVTYAAIILMVCVGSANATTYTSINPDCSISEWESDENLGSGSTSNDLWVTWDASNFYIGIDNWNFESSGSGDIQIYIDTGSGGGTTSVNWDGTRTIANSGRGYEYFYGHEGGLSSPSFRQYSGGNWNNYPTFNGNQCIGYNSAQDSEIVIPWTDIGSPTQATLLVYIKDDNNNTTNAFAYWPNVTGNTATSFTKGYRFTDLGSGFSPNGAPTAVTLSDLSARAPSPALLVASVLLLGAVIVWRRKRA
jgi:hypothetical protein